MFLAIRLLLRLAWLALSIWLLLSIGLFAIMWLPPERFAGIVGKTPGSQYLMGVLPFRRLWSIARDGTLELGDPAPDFDLERHDKSGRVRLSSYLDKQPVVLVFGSYT